MTHGYKNRFGEERIQVSLFQTGNATLDAILADWFFGAAGGNLTNAGNIAGAFAAGVAAIALALSPVSVGGAEAFGSPSVVAGVNLTNAGNIAGAEAFGQPGLSYSIVGAGNIVTAEAFGSPSVVETITASGIATAGAYGQPALSLTITPTGIVTGEALGGGAVSQTVSPSGVSGAEVFGTTVVEEIVATPLYPASIVGGEEFGTATITREYLIQGVVRDRQNNPVSGATAYLFRTADGTLINMGYSLSDGGFRLVAGDDYTNHFVVMFYGASPRKAGVSIDTRKGK